MGSISYIGAAVVTLVALIAALIWVARGWGKQTQKAEYSDEKQKATESLLDGPHTDDDFHKRMQQRIRDKAKSE